MPPKRSIGRSPQPAQPAPETRTEAPKAAPALTLPYPQGWWRNFAYAGAFCLPCLGLALALLYWQGPDRRSRRFSRWCLFLALAGGFFAWMCGLCWTGLQNGEGGIQPW
ncbi:MAG TPA: hypothetical protein VK914_09060 [bacterium]|jgi:hypothetical protein|nr:hypothetical protein [bacterium]